MLIYGSPISAELPSDPGLQDRFWYWHGASGRKYIHSVYAPDCCPPLPGAIYVAVRREGSLRIALSVGRFTPFWDGVMMSSEAAHVARLGIDEILRPLAGEISDCGRRRACRPAGRHAVG